MFSGEKTKKLAIQMQLQANGLQFVDTCIRFYDDIIAMDVSCLTF